MNLYIIKVRKQDIIKTYGVIANTYDSAQLFLYAARGEIIGSVNLLFSCKADPSLREGIVFENITELV